MKSIFSFAVLTTLALTVACSSSQKVEDTPMEAAPAEEMAEPAAVEEAPAEEMEALPELSVNDVETLMKTPDAKVAVYDANGKDTRMSKGVLPGAVMLTSYSEYDLSVLPAAKDTKLVFYCGSTQCTASDKAAVRAKAAGYSDVCVMRAGIKGWIEAGKETAKVAEETMPNKG